MANRVASTPWGEAVTVKEKFALLCPVPCEHMDDVRAGVTAGLKDPTSPRFGTSFVAAKGSSGSVVVCGFVNAKNSFGGYVGEAPFIGVINSAATISERII